MYQDKKKFSTSKLVKVPYIFALKGIIHFVLPFINLLVRIFLVEKMSTFLSLIANQLDE